MRILLCIPNDLRAPKGNSVAALRLTKGFRIKGHTVSVLENCEAADGSIAAASVLSFKPDLVVVMHAWRCAAVVRGAHSAGKIPVVVSLRGTDVNEMLNDKERSPVIRSVLEGCHGITVFSETIRSKIIEYSPLSESKIRVIPNGLELPDSHIDYRQRLGIGRDAFVVIGLAGIRHEKRLLWLLKMLSGVRAKGNDLVYLHGGPVIEKKKGEMFRYFCRREPWIRYEGIIPRDDVASFLRAGDIFVSASRTEGMPHAPREAMLVGLPCLLSDIESHRNIARDRTEALFFNDEDGFYNRLTALMKDGELRKEVAENGRHRIHNELVRGGEIESYLALFAALAGNGNGGKP